MERSKLSWTDILKMSAVMSIMTASMIKIVESISASREREAAAKRAPRVTTSSKSKSKKTAKKSS